MPGRSVFSTSQAPAHDEPQHEQEEKGRGTERSKNAEDQREEEHEVAEKERQGMGRRCGEGGDQHEHDHACQGAEQDDGEGPPEIKLKSLVGVLEAAGDAMEDGYRHGGERRVIAP